MKKRSLKVPHLKKRYGESREEYNARMVFINRRYRKREAEKRGRYNQLMKQLEDAFWEGISKGKPVGDNLVVEVKLKKK